MKDWVIEVKAMRGSHAWNSITAKDGPMYLTHLTKYLNWTALSITYPEPILPDELEVMIEKIIAHGVHEDYHYRFKNLTTGETIPMEVLGACKASG